MFVWYDMVWYPGESVFSTLKYKYLSENKTKNENILTRWSVTQAGSNYEEEKNEGPKSRWTVPLSYCCLEIENWCILHKMNTGIINYLNFEILNALNEFELESKKEN